MLENINCLLHIDMASQSYSALKNLTINDLPLLCNTLNPVVSKCFALGLQLGVEYPQIRAIERNYRTCEDQLREIISERLKQDSPLTWCDIVTALREDSVRESSLASQIEYDHIHHLQPPTSVAPQGGTESSIPPTSSSLTSAQSLWEVRGPSSREYYQPPSLMSGQLSNLGRSQQQPPHWGNYEPPTLMMGQTPVRGPPHGENSQPPTPMMGQTPVRGPSGRGQSWSPVSGPSHRGSWSSVRGPSGRGRSWSLVRGPSGRGQPWSPVRGSSGRGQSWSPVRGPSDRGQSWSPVRGPSERRNHRFQSVTKVPPDMEDYPSPLPMRGSTYNRHYLDRAAQVSPHMYPNHQTSLYQTAHHNSLYSPQPYPTTHTTTRSLQEGVVGGQTVGGPSDRRYYQSQPPVSEPSGSRHYYPYHSTEWEPPHVDDWRSPRIHPPQLTAHPNTPYTSQPYPPTSCMSSPTTRPLQEGVVGGQWDSQSYISHGQPQTSHNQSQRNSSKESCPGHNPPYSWQSLDRGTGNTPHMCFPHQMPQYQTAHPLQVGGQWDGQLYMSHGTSHTQSQRQQSDSSGLGSSPPPPKRPHFEPHPHHVRPNTEPLSTYHQSQTSSSGLWSLPAKTTGVKSLMDQYIDYVKDTYRQSVIEKDPSVLKWPPTPSEVFIGLACIDRRTIVRKEEADEYTRAMIEDGNIDVILNEKKEIDFSDIAVGLAATNSTQKVVLVEGAPGVGKSTFAWEFCRRWERGEIAQQYQLVLLLRLRDERMSRAKSLRDLIYHPDRERNISHAIKCELVDSHGVNTLIILEGFDELPDSQRKENSIFLELILGQLLMHATIMITSRPWATGEIMRRMEHRIFQHIEVLGFTEDNVGKYVTSVFTGEGKKTASAIDQSVGGPDEVSEEAKKNIDDVMAYIGKYPQIKACMYIPLNAAIVVSIYQDSKKGKCILPKTLTELYYALTQILLLRHLYGHADYKEQKWNIDCFEKDLPDEVYKQLLTICKVAYDGICRKGRKIVQLIFSDSDLGGCETLGFMQSVAEVYVKHGWNTSHNFLHLTVQEFLAAFLISTMSSADQLEHFQRHKDGRLRVVLRFLAGLTKLNNVTPDELRSLLEEPTEEQSDEHLTPYCNPMRPDVCVSAHHTNWLFEAQNSELLQSLFHNHTASFTFTRGMLSLEYYSVGYCIANSHSKWSLTFDRDTEEEKISMLLKGAATGDLQQCSVSLKTYTTEIKYMSIQNLNLLLTRFSGCVEELYLRVMTPLSLPHLSALRTLELSLGGKSDVSDFSLPVLESLSVVGTAYNSIKPNTKKALCKLLSSSSSIVHLHFQSKVNDQSMEEIFQSVCDNIVLPLKSLHIDCKCTFTTTATKSLVQFITRSTTLQYLKIDTLEDVDILAKGLSDNIALPLKSLDIDCKCTFTTTATKSLVQFIARNTTLKYLKIHIDTLEDVDILAKGLSDNIALPLKSLDIDCKCTFTTTATRSLVQFITRSTTLQYIRICHVTFSAQGLIELTEAIHHCSRLQEKKLEELKFRVKCSEDVISLRHMIKNHPDMLEIIHWNEVVAIHLSSIETNIMTDSTLNLAFEYCHIESLYLSSKNISDAGAVALAQVLHHNSTLKWVNLSKNNIGDAGAVALAQALHHNSTLEMLILSGNDAIGKESTHQLVQALTVNTSNVILSRRCEKYATQCTQYNTVKDRIRFW